VTEWLRRVLCALTQPAHRPCSLVALRPPLRVCEPFFKISFLALAAAADDFAGAAECRRPADAMRL
jgi:hypothetical protein